MTENTFDAILFEAELNGVFTDLWDYVRHEPAPAWNVGIAGNGPLDRTGEPEKLKFTLNNIGPGGILGYFSPGHANCLTGWRTGIRVRVSFTFDGETKVKYIGWIDPKGINVKPGTTSDRTVEVSCTGYMGKMAEHILNLMQVQENCTLEAAVELITQNMTVQPTAKDYGTGQSVFPTVFDTATTGTTALAEVNKLALSELGYVYTISDGTLVVRGRDDLSSQSNAVIPKLSADSGFELMETGDFVLNEEGGLLILEETQSYSLDNNMMRGAETAYGKHFYNRIRPTAYPRRVDAAATTVLWTLQEAIEIPANSTKRGIRGSYRNPTGGSKTVKGTSMVTPVSGTDFVAYSNATGTGGSSQTANMTVTPTFGAAEVEFAEITNSSGSSIWTGGPAGTFQVRGKGIYFDDVASNVVNDTASQAEQKVIKELQIDMKYQNDPVVTETYANWLIERSKTQRTTLERVPINANRDSASMLAWMYLEPGMRIPVAESMSAIDGDCFIMGYDAEIVGGVHVRWYPVLVDASDMDFAQFESGYVPLAETFESLLSPATLSFGATGYGAVSGGAAQSYDSSHPAITGHPGAWILYSHASNSNSGYTFHYTTPYTSVQGALEQSFIFSPKHANMAGGIYLDDGGFTNYLYLGVDSSLAIHGKTRAASGTPSTTATSYTLTVDAWYTAKIKVNQARTTITFELYNDYGTLLWSDTLTTTIPTASLYPYIYVFHSGAPSGQTNLMLVDYFSIGYKHE